MSCSAAREGCGAAAARSDEDMPQPDHPDGQSSPRRLSNLMALLSTAGKVKP